MLANSSPECAGSDTEYANSFAVLANSSSELADSSPELANSFSLLTHSLLECADSECRITNLTPTLIILMPIITLLN
ncbi:MAG TPA: hypothetical protein VF411_10040 [Bacteroidia bacterium]